ncbi:GTPase HflX [Trichocoleus sp. FACHB-591]|nr:GTPase HflX [Trichocoleus sp. FACHB-591]
METIYGNTQGIKSSQLKQLQRLYEQRQPSDRFCTPELAQELAAVSTAIHHPVCMYLNRRGQVLRVAVGTPAQTQLSEQELPRHSAERLSGVRCLATQLKATPPDGANLTAIARQRLDALVTLVCAPSDSKSNSKSKGAVAKNGTSSEIQSTYLVHLVPDLDQPWEISPLPLAELTEEDFSDLVDDWEKEFHAAGYGAFQFEEKGDDQDKILLVGLMTDDLSPQRFQDGLEELVRLAESAGGTVLETMIQKRSQPHPQTVVGQGKVDEIAQQAQAIGANLVVFDRDISASQIRNLEAQMNLRVVDRTELILDIFAQRAQSQAGKLQVELAQLEYMLPRLRGRGQAMSRLGGGIGTRGPGETKLETERRTIQRRINQLQQEVNQLQAHRSRLRQQRQHNEIPTVALAGYTNAGKSTLLNTLTHAEVYTADQLFATLDPTTRRLTITDAETQSQRSLLLTDTVGFIHELPPPLMDAFRATLEEVTEADAVLHVVDLSHPAWESHIQSVQEVLADLPTISGPTLLVFNKVDQVESEALAAAQQTYPDAVFISATQGLGLETLKQRLVHIATPAADAKMNTEFSAP